MRGLCFARCFTASNRSPSLSVYRMPTTFSRLGSVFARCKFAQELSHLGSSNSADFIRHIANLFFVMFSFMARADLEGESLRRLGSMLLLELLVSSVMTRMVNATD